MNRILILVGITLLSGCASALTKHDYARGPSSDQQFDKDSAACELEATEHRKNVTNWEREGFNAIYDPCMRSKGYARK